MTELPCPNCGSELTFLEQYQRHYCHQCQRYAPDGYGAHGARTCPTCGGVLSYVAQYDRFYCFRCNAYAVVDATPPAPIAPAVSQDPTPLPMLAPEAKPEEPVLVAALPEKTPDNPVTRPVTEPSPRPDVQPAPPQEPQPVVQSAVQETSPSPAGAPVAEPVAATPAEAETEEPSKAMLVLAASKPAVVRVKIFSLRKPELMDLCKAYDLDPSGTKDQMQERLLSYLSDLKTESQPEAEEPGPVMGQATGPPEAERPEGPAMSMAPVTPTPATVTPAEETSEAPMQASIERQSQAVVLEAPPARAVAPEPVPILVTPTVEVPRVEHPCPTCGRELNYISQYARWYCYFCQRYAPVMRAKNACPTCGATLRWIDQYERWWCDACRKYAPADIPGPRGSTIAAARPTLRAAAPSAVEATVSQPTVSAHRHMNPNAGIGLVAFGIVLFITEMVFVEFPAVFSMNLGINVAPEYALVIRFFAFFFVALGAIAGLVAVRERA